VNEATLRDLNYRLALCFLALGQTQEGAMTSAAPAAVPGGHPDAPQRSVTAVLARAAWLAILLGLAMQILILAAKIAAGGQSTRLQLIVDVASGVTWSALVCSGVAIGTVLSRHRAAMMGLLGLVSAPLAWAAAKGVQRGVQSMLSVPVETIGPLVYQVGAAKTLEYALLGVLLGRLVHTPSSTLRTHALTGLLVGLVFGGVILLLNYMHASAAGGGLPAARIAAICVNELLFPIGCATVIYFVARFADRRSAVERLAAGGG